MAQIAPALSMPVESSPATNKRKRANADQPGRPAPNARTVPNSTAPSGPAPEEQQPATEMEYSGVDDNGISQLLAHNAGTHEMPQNHGENATATETAAAALTQYHMGQVGGEQNNSSFISDTSFALDPLKETGATPSKTTAPEGTDSARRMPGYRPPVGSDEWHKIRRDNHKEVERRRREAINEGINELAKIVPGCEKNKGAILSRAVQYISQLKENETANIEKWTLEKLLLDQAITELSTTAERMKNDAKTAWREAEIYKRACENAGIIPEELKDGAEGQSEAAAAATAEAS